MKPSPTRLALLAITNVLGFAAFMWPFVLPAAVGGESAHETDAPWIIAGLMLCLGALLFVELGRGGMGAQAVALIAVLGAAMVALRLPGFVAGASAMFIIPLVAGNSFGPGFGFVLGAVGTFASGLFIGGLGPWLPFQMIAVGWFAAGAGFVPRFSDWKVRVGALAVYGFVAGFLFGAIMNLSFWPYVAGGDPNVGWAPELGAAANVGRYLRFYLATSAGWDSARAIADLAMVVVLGRPLLAAFDRAAKRMRLDLWPRPVPAVDNGLGAGRVTAVWSRAPQGPSTEGDRLDDRPERIEESPDSIGQDAGESPRRGDPWKVPQKTTASARAEVRVKR